MIKKKYPQNLPGEESEQDTSFPFWEWFLSLPSI
jgi:hypothetical protein